jgi:hypothetical protein
VGHWGSRVTLAPVLIKRGFVPFTPTRPCDLRHPGSHSDPLVTDSKRTLKRVMVCQRPQQPAISPYGHLDEGHHSWHLTTFRHMRTTKIFRLTAAVGTAAVSLALVTTPAQGAISRHDGGHHGQGVELAFLGRVTTGAVGTGASEITAYDAATRRVFVVNAQNGTVDVIDVRDPRVPR